MTLEKTVIPGVESVEVPEKRPRRRFTMDEKRRILAAADACSESGEIHALLRREGIYWTYLTNWRQQLKKNGSVPAKRGPKPRPAAVVAEKKQVHELERKLAKMTARAERAEALVDLQKKVAALLATPLSDEES